MVLVRSFVRGFVKPTCGLVKDLRADRVEVLDLDAAQLQDQLHRCELSASVVWHYRTDDG